jgi:hypothetical protein
MVQQICSQCHALRINNDCVAGNCQTVRVFPTVPRQWLSFVNWIRHNIGCPMTDEQQQTVIRELDQHYPAPLTPLAWNESPTIPAAGQVTALLATKDARYLGMDQGRILRQTMGGPWRVAANLGPVTIPAFALFRDRLYAATNLPRGEVWSSQDGMAWEKVADLTETAGGLLSLQVVDNQLYAGTARGNVLRSSDGIHWSPLPVISTGMGTAPVSLLQGFEGYLYAGSAQGNLFRLETGSPWIPVAIPRAQAEPSIGINAAAVFSPELYVGLSTHGQVWKTKDGLHWQEVLDAAPGQPNSSVNAFAATHTALYSAITLPDESSHLFRTRNGIFWEELTLPHPTGRIRKLVGLSDRLIAAVQEGERILIFESMETAAPSRQGEFVVYASPGVQEHASIASNGKNILTVWQAQEEGQSEVSYDIQGALLDLQGHPIGAVPINISKAPGLQMYTNLTFGGGYYFVVWQDARKGGFQIFGSRVDSKGQVMDPQGIPISLDAADGDHLAETVAWDGQSYLVVWHQTQGPQSPNGYEIAGRRIKADGRPLDEKPFLIATGPGNQTSPRVASNGKESLVVWTDSRRRDQDIFATRIDGAGRVLDPVGFPVATDPNNQLYPSVGWNGRSFLVAWVDQRDSSIRAARVTSDGKVLDPEGITVSGEPMVHAFPEVACRKGDVCLVTWEQTSPVPGERDARAARIAPDGRVLDRPSMAVSVYPGQQRYPKSYPLPDRRDFIAVWGDFLIWDTGDIYAKILSFPRQRSP